MEQVVGDPVCQAEVVGACVPVPQVLEEIVVQGREQTVEVITQEGAPCLFVEQIIPVEEIDEVVEMIPQERTHERIPAGRVDVTVAQIMEANVRQFWETFDLGAGTWVDAVRGADGWYAGVTTLSVAVPFCFVDRDLREKSIRVVCLASNLLGNVPHPSDHAERSAESLAVDFEAKGELRVDNSSEAGRGHDL